MKYGFVFPKLDVFEAIKFAKTAEKAGWDAFFVWEPTYGIDAWVTLAALAVETEKIRLGTLLTPPSRMRPWKLASEAITVDILSKGRITISVGLGAIDTGFKELGEMTDLKTRAELLDESLDIITGLWSGNMSNYKGKHYSIEKLFESEFFNLHPPPKLIQNPRIPIWVVGAWSYEKSMKRALSYEGIIPTIKNKHGQFEDITPEHISEIKAYIQENRSNKAPFDIIIEGKSPEVASDISKLIVKPFAEAGATWWIESDWTTNNLESLFKRVKHGPPSF
ncbi:MAG: LLM class flavin-dependent oxidoreductase [Candidatus Lokiarchaeota archaeon]|nr:LLM class flavin-dependent oxidoreductase [Candidatus Lokiarchaeota archaeon]